MRLVKVTNRTRGTVVGDGVEVADTSFTRIWGLLGRSGLKAGGGLWIKPSSGVHTVGMRFPIDVVGLDKGLRIIRLWSSVAPFRVTSVSLRVASVIELPAGHIENCSLEIGDAIEVSHQD